MALTDRDALLALYNATDGPNWRENTSWTTHTDLSDWHGVTVNGEGRVSAIRLHSNNLRGSIPPELGNLRELQSLVLSNNHLTGSIPPELGNIAALQTLRLNRNQLRGHIPPELGKLDALVTFSLRDNQLSGPIPPGLGNLAALMVLNIGGNALSGPIPGKLGDLGKLEQLWLNDNQLIGPIPPDLGKLEALKYLEIGGNRLSGGPWKKESLGEWRIRLQSELAEEKRAEQSGVEERAGLKLESTTRATMDRHALLALYNATDGPDNWGDRTKWNTDAAMSDWHGVKVDNEGRVLALLLHCNNLRGSIPKELGSLSNLKQLWLEQNQLRGRIPPELGKLEALETLSLAVNFLEGSIPPELGALRKLQTLRLNYNNLTGPIPPELGKLEALKNLELGGNELSAVYLPEPMESLGAWRARLQSELAKEKRTEQERAEVGREPSTMDSTDRDALLALYNATDGPNWGQKTEWNTHAALSGWHGVTIKEGRVSAIRLQSNNLRGPIPQELGNLRDLESLMLSNNQLTGPIPPELGKLHALKTLSLGSNQLSGPIPPELGNVTALQTLRLNRNQLSGRLAPELGKLEILDTLSLGANQLSGPIPPELGNLAALMVLSIGGNALSGPIPGKLGDLRKLQQLWLNDNQLTGPIPPELGKLEELKYLELGGNELSGGPGQMESLGAWKTRLLSELAEEKRAKSADKNAASVNQFAKLLERGPSTMDSTGRDALLALYNATDGPNWAQQTEWNTNSAHSGWYGVTMKEGRVWAIRLQSNNLRGPMPLQLGSLSGLRKLVLFDNQLSGCIPKELGKLGALYTLSLGSNHLNGAIPPELGDLRELRALWLSSNQLTGPIPPELGNLGHLKVLSLSDNKLTGPVPSKLGNMSSLQQLFLRGNNLSGGPEKKESLTAWRARLQSESAEQTLAEHERAEQDLAEQSRTEESAGLDRGEADASTVGHSIKSGGSEHLFRMEIASFAELDELTRENREKLEEVKRLLAQPATSCTFPSGVELTDKLGELDSLIAMAKTLGEMTSRYTADLDIQKKEMSLDPGRKAYNVAIRGGLCNAYLAASVVCSGLVSTSKVGVMGKAGTVLELISGLVPLVGGLAGFAGAALKAGDSVLQTRRLEKIAYLAPDAVECSTLAKRLALRLTDGLADGSIAITHDANEHLTPNAITSSPGSGELTEEVDEEVVLEWFVGEVANFEPSHCGATTPIHEEQAGRQLAKRHLRKMFRAVGRGCLHGTSSVEGKVNKLVLVVLPEADIPSVKTPNAPEEVSVRPPMSAPSNDGLVQQLTTQLEALKAEMKSDKEKYHMGVEALEGKIAKVEKRLPKSHRGPGGSVDAGGGHIFAHKQKVETQEEFNERMENPARATEGQTVTLDEFRVLQAEVQELRREMGHQGAYIAALEENQGKKKGLRIPWRGNR
eukprot:g4840.t1